MSKSHQIVWVTREVGEEPSECRAEGRQLLPEVRPSRCLREEQNPDGRLQGKWLLVAQPTSNSGRGEWGCSMQRPQVGEELVTRVRVLHRHHKVGAQRHSQTKGRTWESSSQGRRQAPVSGTKQGLLREQ